MLPLNPTKRDRRMQRTGRVFDVAAIVDHRGVGVNLRYQVRWLGYTEDENTWEPVENLRRAQQFLREYRESADFYRRQRTIDAATAAAAAAAAPPAQV